LNLWDGEKIDADNRTNGINISGASVSETMNGISIGILGTEHTNSNGLNIGPFAAVVTNHNGIILGGIIESHEKCNGVGISLLGVGASGHLNGLYAGFLGIIGDDEPGSIGESGKSLEINGIAVCAITIMAYKLNGLSITLAYNEVEVQHGVTIAIYNKAKELHGIQFGLINHAINNRRLFRTTPFFNFNFRKQ
jgi:hypothetical protein